MNPFEPPTGEQPPKAARTGLQVMGGIIMGIGLLMIAAAVALVAWAYAMRCASDSIACGETKVYAVITAVSVTPIGAVIAFVGFLLYRWKPKG